MSAAANKIDEMPNRIWFDLTIGVSSATLVAKTENTLMSAAEKRGWLVTRVEYMPDPAQEIQLGALDASLGLQLQVGEAVAFEDADDAKAVATWSFSAGGAVGINWPLTWRGPVVIASRKITAIAKWSDDTALLQTKAFRMCVWYHWIELTPQAYIEMAQGAGVL